MKIIPSEYAEGNGIRDVTNLGYCCCCTGILIRKRPRATPRVIFVGQCGHEFYCSFWIPTHKHFNVEIKVNL